MTPYFTDGERTLYQGDAWALAETLPPASIDCLITSPPYWGLRDYGVEGQFGLEKHPQEWIEKLTDLFLRLRPALKQTATIWLNLGDSYCSLKGTCHNPGGGESSLPSAVKDLGGLPLDRGRKGDVPAEDRAWLRPKQLLLLPSRAAIALQDAGFLLRNDMVWRKRNPMPSSVRDRLACQWEHIFLFTVAERSVAPAALLPVGAEEGTPPAGLAVPRAGA